TDVRMMTFPHCYLWSRIERLPTPRHHRVAVKTVRKFFGNFGSIFSYFFWSFLYYLINMVIGTKMRYGVTGIGRDTVGLSYCPFSDWMGKFSNFSYFPHCLSGLFRTVHLGWDCYLFSFNPKSFKYSNDTNLQNKKSVLTEL
ncbi:hypothetical protein, partial [Arcobacter sp.]|uniref:hypothetical protein n=1 Tax=Arcobacter sp. TaxID=1872629 RepID=UPI003D0B35C3